MNRSGYLRIRKYLILNYKRNYSGCSASNQNINLKWPADQIRKEFLDYFCIENKHKFIKSSSVLPQKGSGTYFTNAGMNQFKSIILGEVKASQIFDFSKYDGVANSQKCIRIGGKHSDLDDIGKDTYHHSFFEMLGNWSFNTYNKERACRMALELLVNVYKLDINGLYITYFAGEKELNLQPDLETKNIWLKLGIPENKILPFGMKENFWEMGETGPCGPCTELHYDRFVGANNYTKNSIQTARDLVNAGTERIIEIWNIVFMEFNRINKKNFSPLILPVVDTGMGLERLSAVLNKLNSNYDSDLFLPIFDKMHSLTKHKGISAYKMCEQNSQTAVDYRIFADHMRSITVSIADGLIPSRNGLGGFLKYLILKNLKISNEALKVENGSKFLCQMVPVVVETLKSGYPELKNKTNFIQEVIDFTIKKQNEKINNSIEIMNRYLKKLDGQQKLSGEQVWKLFKGDGSGQEIPIDLIKQYFDSKNIMLDLDRFDQIFLSENDKALRNMKNLRKDNTVFIDLAGKLKNNLIPFTDNSYKYQFEIDSLNQEAHFKSISGKNLFETKILAIAVKNPADGKYQLVENFSNDECIIILEKTNFYPESGGQESDKGQITNIKNDLEINIENVFHIQEYSFHVANVSADSNKSSANFLSINDLVRCKVDAKKRHDTTMNHTGVHILNHSLRKHFNKEDSIIQVNSIVKHNKLKFEFLMNESLLKPNAQDISSVETICKDLIQKAMPIYIKENLIYEKLDESNVQLRLRKLNDILYPLSVRVVSIGTKKLDDLDTKYENDFSAELCCGTHATNTSQLKNFVITHFGALGDSTFEIDALTSKQAEEALENDKIVRNYLNEMIEWFNLKEKNKDVTITEMHHFLHQIADRSIKIENIFKSKPVSYSNFQFVKKEAEKYRPSKNLLQNILKSYLEKELLENSKEASNVLTISPLDPKSKAIIKFLAFESVLAQEQILVLISKIKNIYPMFIIYNKYRGIYIFYSRDPIETNSELKEYFDDVQMQILEKNYNASLVDSSPNHRIIRCPVSEISKDYFVF